MAFHVPNEFRTVHPVKGWSEGNEGFFLIRIPRKLDRLRVIASDGLGWDHVSISLPNRCPTWEEMCFVKSIFWDEDDLVIQYHPPKSDYINFHPHTLHLWRPQNETIPMPHWSLIGPKQVGDI
jgi:hypothetical protein